MSDQLRAALEANRSAIIEGLAQAARELSELRERQREVEALIARARAALGEVGMPNPRPETENRTLHEAISMVLRENSNHWMTVSEIAKQVNHRELYKKRDGSFVEPNQIHARTKNYASVFEKDGPRVRLRDIIS
ncbi:MAG: hypothetical protein EXR50_07610 [Dehalococcoidia bacterium]|nr:hypothetical protein [Dehalococcoidia bacterium]